jgi:hypothetical protein
MARTAADFTASTHTVDELFQRLVRLCDTTPAIARKQILEAFQDDKLQVDFHIRGGARKDQPVRQATEEELRKQAAKEEELRKLGVAQEERQEQLAAMLEHLYERAPPEGITDRVHCESWERVFELSIRDGQLIVVPRCALDFPWDAYSFSVANWELVHEFWPPKPVAPPPPTAAETGWWTRGGRKFKAVNAVACDLWGNHGEPPEIVTTVEALQKLGDELKKREIKGGSNTTQKRAINRRH